MSDQPAASSAKPVITEGDIADFLVHTPSFFERHAEVLQRVQITSPHGKRAVSLQERQLEVLRERIRGLELKIVEMIRNGQENLAIADRLHRWTQSLMLTLNPGAVPGVLIEQLQEQFMIPMAAIRLWHLAPAHADAPFALGISDDIKLFTSSLDAPYCGANSGFEAAGWLVGEGQSSAEVASMALLPLKHPTRGTIGLLALGSPDPTRYQIEMGTEFLERIAAVASAGVVRLIQPVE